LRSRPSCYDILQVPASASADEIRQAYLDLVRVWHPDRFVSDPRLQKVAEEKLKEITEAYELLSAAEPKERSPGKPKVRIGANGLGSGLWLKAAGFGLLFLSLWFLAGPGLSALMIPADGRAFMNQEALRMTRRFGPDPAIASDGSEGLGSLRGREPKAGGNAHRDLRPANGADLLPRRNAGGLGELHVLNQSDLDCIVQVVSRETPGKPLRAVYIRSAQDAIIYGLPPDVYRLRVAFGRDLNSSSVGFVQSLADDYWVGPFEFFQIESSKSRRGERYSVALKSPASASVY
jgi:hypothetical protein